VSYAVVNWVDVFVRNEYKQELIQSWKYCQEHKGLEIYGRKGLLDVLLLF
jgi:hypothetical protein